MPDDLKAQSDHWLEGIRAREANKPRSANPYIEDPDNAHNHCTDDWWGGWDMADMVLSIAAPNKKVA